MALKESEKQYLRDLNQMMRNQVYRHYKGNLYKVRSVSHHTETEEITVNYSPLDDNLMEYSRPLDIFNGAADSGDKRFIPVTLNSIGCCP